MTQAGTPADKRDSSENLRSLEMMQSMMATMPPNMHKEMEKGMKHMLEKGPTPLGRTIMSNMGIDPDSFIGGIREGLQEIKQQEQTPVEIHFYHCDHLGTPIALTDRNGKIVWAAKYDPWGNIEEEFNPYNIEQNIRLPGQHHDRETGLYYNRHRYYDPKRGAYINQDPIGLDGGVNLYQYAWNSPTNATDPKGLLTVLGGVLLALAGAAVYCTCKAMFSGGKKMEKGSENIRRGQEKKADLAECLGKQATQGYKACPRTGEALQEQHSQGIDQVRQGIGQASEGAVELATSVPNTSITGPAPTSVGEAAGSGITSIITGCL
jgi:RHS repeat-associated protein